MKVTAADVAKLAGVSRTTVSLVLTENTSVVLSEPTKKRVIEAAKQLQYGPFSEKRMSPYAKEFAAVILPTLLNPFYPESLNSITSILSDYGYKTLIHCTNKNADSEKAFLKGLDKRSVKMILFTYTPLARETAKAVAGQIPTCVLGELNFSMPCLNIALDSENAGYWAIKHLWENGRRKICFVSNGLNSLSLSRKKRLDGIKKYAAEVGAADSLFLAIEDKESDEYETGYRQTLAALAKNPEIDAVIGVNDLVAIGAMNAIRDHGAEVPGDIAVVGFDNSKLASHYTPKLTSVEHHIYDRAKLAIATLLDDKRKTMSKKIIYEPTLVIRESSGQTSAELSALS